MFARNRYGLARWALWSFGLKSANTLSCVSSVTLEFTSPAAYSPAHLKVRPGRVSKPDTSTPLRSSSPRCSARKSSPTTATTDTGARKLAATEK